MRELIDDVMQHFMDVNLPLSDARLTELLDLQTQLTDIPENNESSRHLGKLQELFSLLDALHKERQILKTIQMHTDSEAKLAKLQTLKDQLAVQIKRTDDAIHLNYQQIEKIEDQAKDHKPAADPLKAVINVSDSESQKQRIHHLFEESRAGLRSISELCDRIKLKKSGEEQAGLIQDLKLYSVIISTDAPQSHAALKLIVEKDIASLRGTQQSLQECQQNLTCFLSSKNHIENIQELDQRISSLKETLEQALQKMRHSTLNHTRQQELQDIYQKTLDPKGFISDLQERKGSMSSYFRPYAWYHWAVYNQDYLQKSEILESDIQFLELIDEAKNLQASLAAAQAGKEKLQSMSAVHSKPLDTEDSIVSQSLLTLGSCSQQCGLNSFNFSDKPSITDLLSTTIQFIDHIDQIIEKKKQAKHILERLIFLDKSITHLRIQYGIIESNQQDTLELLEKQLEEKKQFEYFFIKRKKLCKSYLKLAAKLETLKLELQTTKASISKLQRASKQLKKQNHKHPDERQVLQNIEQYEDTFNHVRQQLIEFGPMQRFSDDHGASLNPSDESLVDVIWNEPFKTAQQDDPIYQPWKSKIESELVNLPSELQRWYSNLSRALENQALSKTDKLRAVQLLRDIYFECKNHEDASFIVLFEYQSICEDPQQNLSNILPLKPAFLPRKNALAEIQHPQLNRRVATLYEQSKKLQKNFPVEAKLLFQATQSIHHSALEMEKHSSEEFSDYSFSLLTDPRYNRLKKHRGFLKLWESIETFFSDLMSKIKASSPKQHSESFCFFRTKSVKLLKKAEQEVADLRMEKQNHRLLGSVDNCSISPTWRGLSAPSRRSMDTADKPRYVGTLEDLKK